MASPTAEKPSREHPVRDGIAVTVGAAAVVAVATWTWSARADLMAAVVHFLTAPRYLPTWGWLLVVLGVSALVAFAYRVGAQGDNEEATTAVVLTPLQERIMSMMTDLDGQSATVDAIMGVCEMTCIQTVGAIEGLFGLGLLQEALGAYRRLQRLPGRVLQVWY